MTKRAAGSARPGGGTTDGQAREAHQTGGAAGTDGHRQRAPAVFMVRPSAFGFNPETAASNVFQKRAATGSDVVRKAQEEFDGLEHALREAGVQVLRVDDTPEPTKPDAVFPNNWLSTHEDGTLVLYPMQAANRRLERRPAIVEALGRAFRIRRVVDLTAHEREGRYLEGTGSLVLDRRERRAYAARSPRTDPDLLRIWGETLGYVTTGFETRDADGVPIYHTNVLMAIGTRWAVIGTGVLRERSEQARMLSLLRDTGHEVLELTPEQVGGFAGNILELEGHEGPLIVISHRGWAALDQTGRRFLERYGNILEAGLDVIETVGGGGVRCMLAEIFLPPRLKAIPSPGSCP